MIKITNPSILRTLEFWHEHPSPFSQEEIDSIDSIAFNYRSFNLCDIEYFDHIKELRISKTGHINSLQGIKCLTDLKYLTVSSVPISDLSPLLSLSNLTRVIIRDTLVEDISCLVNLKCNFASITIENCMCPHGYSKDLIREVSKKIRAFFITTNGPEFISLTHHMRNVKGWNAMFYEGDCLTDELRVFIPNQETGFSHHRMLSPYKDIFEEVKSMILDPDLTDIKVFASEVERIDTVHYEEQQRKNPPFDVEAHIEEGDAEAALGWIESAEGLHRSTRRAMREFVQRFPEARFYREDEALLDHWEEVDECKLPQWLRRIRTTLVGPCSRLVCFEGGESFALGAGSDTGAEQTDHLSEGGWWTVGWTIDGEQSITFLGVNIDDPDDRSLRVHDIEDFTYGDRVGNQQVAFWNHADFFDSVVAITEDE